MSTDALPHPDPALLPDDPTLLKALVVQLLEGLRSAQARLERQEHHMHLLLKRIYGSTSEKLDPRRGVLFDAQAGEEETPPVPPPAANRPSASASENRDRHGRGRIPDQIERKEAVHDLTDAEKAALGGAGTSSSCRRKRASNSTGGPRRCSSSFMSARCMPAVNRFPRAA